VRGLHAVNVWERIGVEKVMRAASTALAGLRSVKYIADMKNKKRQRGV
jgi:hypothetical protein